MMVKEVTNKQEWEDFVLAQNPHSFLQSWNWGAHHKNTGHKIFRLGVYTDQLVAAALVIKISARRGTFLFCPHGPVINKDADQMQVMHELVIKLREIGQQEKCDFIRISPLALNNEANAELYKNLSFKPAPVHMMHPELAWILDINKSEEEILKGMRKVNRYSIRKAEKDGVDIETSSNPDDIEKFWDVYQQTVQRQHFVAFKKDSLKDEFATFADDDQIKFFFAKYNDEIIAAAMIVFYGNSAYYHHSGSIHKYPKISAPHLLQWHVILEAKKRNCQLYNFWGVSEEGHPKHPWAGLSFFKRGFGGQEEDYLHAQDLILTKKYWLTFVIEKIRRWKRGL